MQSPIGLVPKAGGQTRLIFHLSYDFKSLGFKSVNHYTPKEKCMVKYRDLDHTVQSCLKLLELFQDRTKRLWFGKSDLKSAFRILGLAPGVWWLLVLYAYNPMTGEKQFFFDKCLPFGHSISCALFQSLSDSLAHIFKYLVHVKVQDESLYLALTNYLDDFLFAVITQLFYNFLLQSFLDMCEDLGVPVSFDKTEWGTTIIVFLGILLDGNRMVLAVPEEKRIKALNLLQNFVNKKSGLVKEMYRLAGLLNFLCKAITPGRVFTRRMYAKFTGIFNDDKFMKDLYAQATVNVIHTQERCKLKSYHHVRLDREFKDDCKVWIAFLETGTSSVCRPFIDLHTILQADDIGLFSDAAKGKRLGFRATFKNKWLFGQ